MKRKHLEIGMLVSASNETYSYEGKIKSIFRSMRGKTLYEVGFFYFSADEIRPLVMPSMYEHIATEMLRRDCMDLDKRIVQLSVDNPNFNFGKQGNKICVSINAFGKHFEKSYTLDEIKHQFYNWSMKDQPSFIWATRNK